MGKGKKGKKHEVIEPRASLAHNPFTALSELRAPDSPAPPHKREDSIEHQLRFPKKIVVRREVKGRAGKTVTRISGVPSGDLAALASEMKKALGCAATTEGCDLVLLGSLVDRAADWLEAAGATKIVKSI